MAVSVDQLSYFSLGKKLRQSEYIFAKFFILGRQSLRTAAEQVASESSIGTWTGVKTLSQKTFKRLAARIISLDLKNGLVTIAYPLALFEPGNLAQLLSGVAGNIFSLKTVPNIRLLDLEFPKSYLASFRGPAFGLNGVRKQLKIYHRPLIGGIMKPKIGLTWSQHAKVAYQAFCGGVDLIKDDENLTDLPFNRFALRVRATLQSAKKAEQKTGQKKLCAFNVSAPADEMIERARFINKMGGNCAMVDIMTVGFSGLQALRNAQLNLILHGHRAMHSAMTRDPKHGISMLVIAKLARLAGIDQLHTGTVVGKMEGSIRETAEINKFIMSDWSRIKPVMPIASGGLHPGLIPKLCKITGPDVIINFGGGLHGHPGGTYQGALAIRQAIDAVIKGTSLKLQAKNSQALAAALKKWK